MLRFQHTGRGLLARGGALRKGFPRIRGGALLRLQHTGRGFLQGRLPQSQGGWHCFRSSIAQTLVSSNSWWLSLTPRKQKYCCVLVRPKGPKHFRGCCCAVVYNLKIPACRPLSRHLKKDPAMQTMHCTHPGSSVCQWRSCSCCLAVDVPALAPAPTTALVLANAETWCCMCPTKGPEGARKAPPAHPAPCTPHPTP